MMRSKDHMRSRPRPLAEGGEWVTVIDSLLDHKKLIAATTAIALLIGLAYAFLSPPIYEADALIKVGDTTDMTPPIAADALSYYVAPPLNERSSAESEVQIIGSRNTVSQAVSDRKLYIETLPRYFPLIGAFIARHNDGLSSPGVLGLGGYAWGREKIEVDSFEVPEKLLREPFALRFVGDGRYELSGSGLKSTVTGRIGVQERFQSTDGPLTLLVASIDSNPGGEFTITRESEQQLVDELRRNLKVVEQGTKSNVVKASLRGRDPAVVAMTVKAIVDQYVAWNKNRKAKLAEDSLSYLSQAIPDMENKVKEAESAYNSYRNKKGLLDINQDERLLAEQIADNTSELLALKRKRRELSVTLAEKNPNVVAVDEQIGATEREIDRLKSRVRAMPADEQGALELLRKVKGNTDLYLAMRKYGEEMRLVSAGKTGTAEIIDPVEVPKRPVWPVKWMVMLASLAMGLALGGGSAVVRDRLLRGVTDTDDIESSTGLNVYATIPLSRKQTEIARRADSSLPQQLPLAVAYPRDPAVESLRMFRPALQLLMAASPNNVVMLAGPLPGIGKSFLSANLATVLAAGGKRVLLIDGDLRKGQLYRHFRATPAAGFSDVLSNLLSFDEAITKGVAPNLDLLQTGVYPLNAADLLMGERFKDIVGQASRAYDIVLIDAPAVLAISDAGVMAPAAGSIFLVAHFAETLVGEIDASIKRLTRSGARISGILLNGVSVHNSNYALARRYGTHAYVAYRYDSDQR
jgi:tyrosine-protein kinase Etk/Wzc